MYGWHRAKLTQGHCGVPEWVSLCASYKTTVEIHNLYWIYYANKGYLTVYIINFYSRCIAGTERHSLKDMVHGVPEWVSLCARYKTPVEICNLYWIYYANRGYLTV